MLKRVPGAGWLVSKAVLYSSLAYVSLSLVQVKLAYAQDREKTRLQIDALERQVEQLQCMQCNPMPSISPNAG